MTTRASPHGQAVLAASWPDHLSAQRQRLVMTALVIVAVERSLASTFEAAAVNKPHRAEELLARAAQAHAKAVRHLEIAEQFDTTGSFAP